MFGLDISKEAIKITNNLLKDKALNAELVIGSMFESLPYNSNFLDAIICIRALNHGTIEQIREGIKEFERILKPGGLIFITVRKKVSKRKRLPFKQISPRTYIPLEGAEKGIVHYLFNKKILRKESKHFQIIFLNTIHGPRRWESYYYLLGKQNNQTLKDYLGYRITVYEGEIIKMEKKSYGYNNEVVVYFIITIKGARFGPQLRKKSDYDKNKIIKKVKLMARVSEDSQQKHDLKAGDKISLNGGVNEDRFLGIYLKRVSKINKL